VSGTLTTAGAASAIAHDEATQQPLPAMAPSQFLSPLAGEPGGDSLDGAAWSGAMPGMAIAADGDSPEPQTIVGGAIVCPANSINARTPAARRTAKRWIPRMLGLAGVIVERRVGGQLKDSPAADTGV
jgi:hypothetical protein